jgi:hypothetical protein
MPRQDAVIAITGGIDIFDDQRCWIWSGAASAMRIESFPDAIAQECQDGEISQSDLYLCKVK